MADRNNMGTNIPQGMVSRIAQGLRYVISGVGPEDWFGPQQPLAPQAQEATEGRQFDYPVGYNLRITPRSEEAVSFMQLRYFADSYDLLRLIIETRKDQVEAFEWEIVPEDNKESADKYAEDIKLVRSFINRPDRQNPWAQWLRMILEEILVIDAVCIYPRKTRGGGVYGFELVDGSTIKKLIDDGGRTPFPPNPAYQQVLKGIPTADYTMDDLIYSVRNPRVWKLYGYSPVEQIIMTVNIALRRQLSQLEFYTAGNVPEAIAQVPDNWTPKQIAEFQTWWDSLLAGNSGQKRRMHFIPKLEGIEYPKKEMLKDEFDEWLARIVCFAFSISPTALIKQVNRASGEQMADTAKEEGLFPLLHYISSIVTSMIQKNLGMTHLKFRFRIVNEVDPKTQADIHTAYVDRKVLTPDEIREDLGRDAMTPEQREAAWPAPPPMPDPFGVPGEEGGNTDPPSDEIVEDETAAEKMLAKTIEMLDPSKMAKLIMDAAKSQAPRIIEVKPEVNVEVGDTNVHMPVKS
jgi:PAS domain-containing protein